MGRPGYVYIITNIACHVLYTGVTSDLVQRIYQHKQGSRTTFAGKYRCHRLVYYEVFADIEHAIAREKQLKAGSRRQKVALIESFNPQWRDLYEDLTR